MDVDECDRIVRAFHRERIIPSNLTVKCTKWDGEPKTRTARGYFTADPLVGTRPSSDPSPVGTIVLIPERVYGGEKEIRELLSHELVHAYDHCTLRRDLTTCEELACSEIRAAREAECSGYDTAILNATYCRFVGGGTEFCNKVKRTCVERIAERSTRSVFSEEQSKECVRKVFDRCYADLSLPGRDAEGKTTTVEPPIRTDLAGKQDTEAMSSG